MKFFKKFFLLSLCLTLVGNSLNAADPRRALRAAINNHDIITASMLLKEVEEFFKAQGQPRLFLAEQAKFNAEFAKELEKIDDKIEEEEEDDDEEQNQKYFFIDDSTRRESYRHLSIIRQFKQALTDNDFSRASELLEPLENYYRSAGQAHLFSNALAEYQNKFSRQIRRKRRQFVERPTEEESYLNDEPVNEEFKAELKEQMSDLYKQIELIVDQDEGIIDEAVAESFLNVLKKAEASGIKLTEEQKRKRAELISLQVHEEKYKENLQKLNDGTLAKGVVAVIKKQRPPVAPRNKAGVEKENVVVSPLKKEPAIAANQDLELVLKQGAITINEYLSFDQFIITLNDMISSDEYSKKFNKYKDQLKNNSVDQFNFISYIIDEYIIIISKKIKLGQEPKNFFEDDNNSINLLIKKLDETLLTENGDPLKNGSIENVKDMWTSLNDGERQLFYKICNTIGYMKTPNPRITIKGGQAGKIPVVAAKPINPLETFITNISSKLKTNDEATIIAEIKSQIENRIGDLQEAKEDATALSSFSDQIDNIQTLEELTTAYESFVEKNSEFSKVTFE